MWRLVVVLLLLAAPSPSPCTVSVEPSISIAPLRYLRITTHLADPAHWHIATLYLVDEVSEVTRDQLFEGADMAAHEPRTRITEWRTLAVGEGVYEVQLVAAVGSERCVARRTVEVH